MVKAAPLVKARRRREIGGLLPTLTGRRTRGVKPNNPGFGTERRAGLPSGTRKDSGAPAPDSPRSAFDIWGVQPLLALALLSTLSPRLGTAAPALELIEQRKIWDGAPHNAFTDLRRFHNGWLCVFREGSAHEPGSNGVIRVLQSADGVRWESAARIDERGIDLRDPKLSEMPDGRLMLLMGGSTYSGEEGPQHRRFVTARTRASFSADGRQWSAPAPVSVEGEWLWRVTWHKGIGYGMGYTFLVPAAQVGLTLWRTTNGLDYTRIGKPVPPAPCWPDETTLRFQSDDTLVALVRNEKAPRHAYIGISRPPYQDWSWADGGHAAQGPNFLVLPDGRMIYGGRDFQPDARTVVGLLTATNATPLLTLPSGGDTSYPGLAWDEGRLWVSYYASHEGKTAIYLAKARLAPDQADADFFPLMAWNTVPSDLAALRQMRECGLTVAGFAAPKDLDLCQAAGLKAIVQDPRVSGYNWKEVDETLARSNVTSLVRQVGEHPAVYGYYLTDEPDAGSFGGLGKVASLIRELAPGRWPYINLFPNYATPGQLAAATYTAYLDQFIATCRPTTLSYDHYALMDDGSLRNGYWQNLEQMRLAAGQARVSFWNIVLTVAHFNYRELTAGDARFQVYSTLAYGGRGLAYFTYFAPKIGNYRMAPIDQFGHATPTWHHLQQVNLQVARLAPTLLQLSSDDVYHFGTVPELCRGPGGRSLVQTMNAGEFVVGDFSHQDGSRYVMIVNKNPAKSCPCAPRFRGPVRQCRLVSPYDGRLTAFVGEQCWLAPGQGLLLKPE